MRSRRDLAQQRSVEQAENYVGALLDAMEILAANPERGRPADGIRATYRRQAVGSHVVFYVPKSYGIAIIRVLHQRMDFDTHLA